MAQPWIGPPIESAECRISCPICELKWYTDGLSVTIESDVDLQKRKENFLYSSLYENIFAALWDQLSQLQIKLASRETWASGLREVKVSVSQLIWAFSLLNCWTQWLRNGESLSEKEIDRVFISRTRKAIKREIVYRPITYFSNDSTCFSLSLNKYVGFAAISQSSLGRHISLKESLILWFASSRFRFCSSLCFSFRAFLKNFISTLSCDVESSWCFSS